MFAVLGVRVSEEATLWRTVGRLCKSRKKDPKGQHKEMSFEASVAYGATRPPRDPERLVFVVEEMGTHTSLAPL